MTYHFEKVDQDYTDYASGRVLFGQPGVPAFPVRLASEIFQRCLRHLDIERGIVLYDPCCGGWYLLTVLASLHWDRLISVIASDADDKAVALARRNLGLLTLEGLDHRALAVAEDYARFGKESHGGALQSAAVLRKQLVQHIAEHPLQMDVFQANAFDSSAIQAGLQGQKIHLVMTDIPHGNESQWIPLDGRQSSGQSLLEALQPVLSADGLVAICADKQVKIAHEGYQQVARIKIGKRQAFILKLKGS